MGLSEKDLKSLLKRKMCHSATVPPSERAPEGESINNSSPSVQNEKKRKEMQSLSAQTEIPRISESKAMEVW